MREYLYPRSIEGTIQCLAAHEGNARVIAGGTDVLPDVRKARITPSCLVDITRIPMLNEIEVACDLVTIGAAVTFERIREHPFLRQQVQALVDAARSVGAGAIQNAATLVGNIVQAMPAGDGSVVAVALDAEARIADCDGARWRPVESLFRGPGVSAIDPTRQLVTHIRFPRLEANMGTAWRRVGRRSALVLPILNCAVRVHIDEDGGNLKVVGAAIALGPVAPRPFRAREAEAFLQGRLLTDETLADAGQIAQGEASPRTSVLRASREYRLAIIPTLVGEALAEAGKRAMR